MTWHADQHDAAVAATRTALEHRPDADLDPRVIEAIALENTGTTAVPRTRTDAAVDRALRSGRYERWTTLIWRARLAQIAGRTAVRRAAFASDDPLAVLEDAGLGTRTDAEHRAAKIRQAGR